MKRDCQFDKSKAIKLLDFGLGYTNEEKNPSLVTGALVLLKGGNVALCHLFARPLPLAVTLWCLVYGFDTDSIATLMIQYASSH